MKKVFLEMEKMKDLNSGLGQFCFHYGKAISELKPLEFDPQFYVPSNHMGIFGKNFSYRPVNKIHRLLPIQERYDVWHCLQQGSPYLPAKNSTKVVLTIHDLNFLEEKKHFIKQKLRLRKIQNMANRADVITVISNFTERVVRENLDIRSTPIRVIHNGNSLKAFEKESRPAFVPKGNYFFSIGIIAPKKNFITLVPLLRHFKNFNLIIAGNNSNAYVQEILSLAKSMGVADRIIMPGKISDEEKFWLYKNCTAFLFPSIAEGFGLPVVEAMSLGKPVFLSKATSLPEIGGKEAFYFKNFESENMIDAIEKGLVECSNDKEKIARTMNWSKQFSWAKAAAQYQDLYLNL
jgi:glycosyltransferase involved in cell wall biosynthesis